MIKSLDWYKKDTEKLIDACTATGGVDSIYCGFWFANGDAAAQYDCRETFSSAVRPKFRKNGKLKARVWLVVVRQYKSSMISKIGNMRRQIHILEKKFGYVPHEIECVSTRRNPQSFGCRWKITASPWWRQGTPMFSMFLGEMRRYFETDKQGVKLKASLLEKILTKRETKEVFGKDRTTGWDLDFSSTFGRDRFERKVRGSKKLQERLGVKKNPPVAKQKRYRWSVT